MTRPDTAEPEVSPQSTSTAVQEAPRNLASGTLDPDAAPRDTFLNDWLRRRLDAVALAVLAAGLGLRIFAAATSYLNPDEALHYLLINQHSLWLAYRASLTNAHPPLIYVLVYFWHFLGHSELMLRLPSVITGTAFCWALYKWIGIVFGKTAGMVGLILAAFSPALIALSAELRSYALLLFCMAFALYFLAQAFDDNSVPKMWCFSAFLYLAILSHYSAVFFTIALGLYCLARIVDSRPPQKVMLAWAAGQAGALAIYIFLYFTHVSKLKERIAMWALPFDATYFHADNGNIYTFTKINTVNIFLFLFGQQYVALAMLVCFLACGVFLFGRDLVSHRKHSPSDRVGILLLFPFIAVWGASIAGIYPYVGSRHTVFLAPFAIAGAAYFLSVLLGQRLWAGLLAAVLLVSVTRAYGQPGDEDAFRGNNSPAVMVSAMNYMKQTIPPGDRILADWQSGLALTYYFCGPTIILPIETFTGEYYRFTCDSYPIVSLHIWKLIGFSFPFQFEKMVRANGLSPGDRVWVFQTGWGPNLGTELDRKNPAYRCLAPKTFGDGIALIPFVVGPDFSPAAMEDTCSNSEIKNPF